MIDTRIEETSPDTLMDSFRGRSMQAMFAFTLVVHVVLLGGTSTAFLWKTLAGDDQSKMSETERMDNAVREATSSLRAIAEKNGVKPQDLSARFAGGAPKAEAPKAKDAKKEEPKTDEPKTDEPKTDAPKTDVPKAEVPKAAEGEKPAQPEAPKSTIEKGLEKKAQGPAVPSFQDDDLLK